jgi:hypothetical protein
VEGSRWPGFELGQPFCLHVTASVIFSARSASMAPESGKNPRARRMPFTNPWSFLLAGLGTAMLALLIEKVGDRFNPLLVVLVLASMLLALGGVGIRLRLTSEDVEDRFKTAGAIALGSFVALLCAMSMKPQWDTAILLLGVFVGVGIVTALLVLVPRLPRRLIITILVVIHFGGMFTSFASVNPPGGQSGWVVNMAWTLFYRPYLHFIYMTNAYHFYSPNPGEPSLLWFHVEYEGGKTRWIEIPSLQESPTRMAFQRRLALTESTNQIHPGPYARYNERYTMRIRAGDVFKPQIPRMDNYPGNEYREPTIWAKKHIASYARYVARNFPCEDDPSLPVKSVKVYRALHLMLGPAQIGAGDDPYDPTMYLPYYQGAFDPDGNLLDGHDADGNETSASSPFLYWLIPIVREPVPGEAKKTHVVNYAKIHAKNSRP